MRTTVAALAIIVLASSTALADDPQARAKAALALALVTVDPAPKTAPGEPTPECSAVHVPDTELVIPEASGGPPPGPLPNAAFGIGAETTVGRWKLQADGTYHDPASGWSYSHQLGGYFKREQSVQVQAPVMVAAAWQSMSMPAMMSPSRGFSSKSAKSGKACAT